LFFVQETEFDKDFDKLGPASRLDLKNLASRSPDYPSKSYEFIPTDHFDNHFAEKFFLNDPAQIGSEGWSRFLS